MNSETRVSARWSAVAACACFALAGCADLSRGTESVAVDAGSDVAALDGDGTGGSFTTLVHPLLLSGCQRCHAANAEAGDTQLLFTGAATSDFAVVSRLVDTGAPAESRLLSKASGNGHGGGAVFAAGSPDYQTVLQWIQQGARP